MTALVGGVLLCAWLLISVVAQIVPRRVPFHRLDTLGLIPRWSFFAPNPGVHDYYLLYRDRHSNGSYSLLKEVQLVKTRRAFHAVWHPEKRIQKVVTDCVAQTSELLHVNEIAALLSTPYLVLVTLVLQQPRSKCAIARQVVIAQRISGQTPALCFVSRPFALI